MTMLLRNATVPVRQMFAAFIAVASATVAYAEPDVARDAARQMERLAGDADFAGAQAVLSAVNCAGDVSCQTVLDFSYGWLFESRAAAEPEHTNDYLQRAQAYYNQAHRANPGNTQILNNLALVAHRLGDNEAAVAATQDAIALAPQQAYAQYLFLGDIYAEASNDAAAINAYQAAIKENPADGAAQQRLLEAWRKSGAYESLYTYSGDLRDTQPDLAATGYRYAINLGYVQDPALAEHALVAWTAVCSDLGVLTTAALTALPAPGDWPTPALATLAGVVASSGAAPAQDDLSWWLQTAERQDAIARSLRLKAARLRADAERSTDDKDRREEALHNAIDYLRAAVATAPPFGAYLEGNLASASNVRLDAAADLVALHYALKAGGDADPLIGESMRELERMTEILFSGKAGAYAAGQLDAIQRYHTVLGMIYFSSGRLTSTWADNASFQLEHALSVADKIAAGNAAKYRPLPELQGLLADVYRQRDRLQDSARLSLSAAMGYLETDNLAAAEQALGNARAHGADAPRTAAVTAVLSGRLAIASRGLGVVTTPAGNAEIVLEPELAWVAEPELLDLPARFVSAQRFKALADLGVLLDAAGRTDLAREVNAFALDAYGGQRTLLSPVDLRRLRSVDSSISRRARDRAVTEAAGSSGAGQGPAGYTQAWTVQSAAGQTRATVNTDMLKESREIVEKEMSGKKVLYREYQH